MWLSLSEQTAYFLWSLVLGLALGLLYDLVRAVRMLLRARGLHIVVSDVVFFTLCGVLTALFALPFNKGDVRGFIIFGEAVGFLTYRLTLGSIMGKIYAHLATLLRKVAQKILGLIEKIFTFLLKILHTLLYNVGVVIDKSLKRAAEKRKLRRAAAKRKLRGRAKRKDRKHEQKRKKKIKGKRRRADAGQKRR